MEISSHRFLERSPARSISRCPKCQSIFIDQQSCESCGYQLAIDLLGEPLGPKSYYYLKNDYDKFHTYFGIALPLIMRPKGEVLRYRMRLERRFSILLDYLLSDRDATAPRRRIFWTEMRDLVQEILRYGEKGKTLTDLIEEHPGHQEYRIVSSELINHIVSFRQQMIMQDFSSRLKDIKIAGVISLSSLLLASFFIGVILLLSLSWYQYLLAR